MTPNTTQYMILGYAIFTILMAVYLASLVIRQRSLKRDLELLQELELQEKLELELQKKPEQNGDGDA